MAVAKHEIKRIGVFSAVKTLFVLGGFGGFVLGIMKWALLGIILWGLRRVGFGAGDLIPELDQLFGAGIGMLGFVMPVVGAMIGAVMGVVFGFLFAGMYNVSARLWGGLELELAETIARPPAIPVVAPSPHRAPTPLPGKRPTPSEPQRDGAAENPTPSFE